MSEVEQMHERVAVVSGAGTGIGQAIATKFCSLGWPVAIGGRRVEVLADTVSLVEGAGGTCFAQRLDVADPDSVEEFFAAAEAALGPVGVVVNNAAVGTWGSLDELSPEEIEADVAVKLLGSLYMARRAIQSMRPRHTGDIVFITSTSGVEPWPFHLPYAAANAGVEHAARTLRLELEGTGIRVHALRSGNTAGTEFGLHAGEAGKGANASDFWFRRGLIRHAGMMTTQTVADAVAVAVTMPPAYQFELLSVIPTAPVGDLPLTYQEFVEQMMSAFLPPDA